MPGLIAGALLALLAAAVPAAPLLFPAPEAARRGGAGAARAAAAPVSPALRANKALVRRYLIDVLGGGHPELLDQLVAATFLDRTPGAPNERGPAAVRAAQDKIHRVFAKVEYLVQELVAEDDRVVARYLVQATPRLQGGGLAAPPVVVNGITIFKLAGGKIEETWIMNDQLNIYRQLGFTLEPPRDPRGAGSQAPRNQGAGALAPPPPPR